MPLSDMLIFVFLIAGVVFWWSGSKCKEFALTEARRLCRFDELQLLDQTVEQIQLRLSRNRAGSVCFRREYIFEFTYSGDRRYQGRITLISGKVTQSDLDVYRVYSEDGGES